MPAVSTSVPGVVVVRVPANAYQEEESGGLPGMARYCPEQAWVFFGAVGAPEIRRLEGADVDVSLGGSGPPAAGQAGTVVWISGNAALVEQVLTQADWSVLRALVEG